MGGYLIETYLGSEQIGSNPAHLTICGWQHPVSYFTGWITNLTLYWLGYCWCSITGRIITNISLFLNENLAASTLLSEGQSSQNFAFICRLNENSDVRLNDKGAFLWAIFHIWLSPFRSFSRLTYISYIHMIVSMKTAIKFMHFKDVKLGQRLPSNGPNKGFMYLFFCWSLLLPQ